MLMLTFCFGSLFLFLAVNKRFRVFGFGGLEFRVQDPERPNTINPKRPKITSSHGGAGSKRAELVGHNQRASSEHGVTVFFVVLTPKP